MLHDNALDELAIKYKIDKSSNFHDYCKKYQKYIPFSRDQNLKILELGIAEGGSLNLFSEYYYNSIVVGVDIEERCKQYSNNKNIFTEIGSQDDVNFLNTLIQKYGQFDIIIDDCSHQQDLTIKSFEILFPYLKKHGIYVIEDVCCSYWTNYKGGYRKEGTSIEYFKNLIDDVNFSGQLLEEKYSPYSHIRKDDLLVQQSLDKNLNIRTDIESINFLNSIIIINKR